METIGLIGIGHIGKGFADLLLKADYPLVGYDIDDSQVEYLVDLGGTAVEDPAAVAERADVVVMALPGTPEVEATIEGERGLLAGASAGDLVIDVTTTLPETSELCEARCADRGVDFVEAPITGGAPRAGTHMMVGGTVERYETAREILDVLCDDHIRIGAIGEATIFKLGLQLRYAGHHAVDAEVVEFLSDNGVDPEPLNEFLEMNVWERYFTDEFDQEIEGLGGLAIWNKDVGYARQVAQDQDTALPLAGVVNEAYKATVRRVGDRAGSAAAIVRYWRTLNGTDR